MSMLDAMWSMFSSGKKMSKLKDSVTLGLTSGFLATVVMDISNYILFRRKRTEFLFGHLAGSMLMRPIRTHQRKNFVLGQIFHMITGSILGIPMVYVLRKTGKDYHLLKGAAMGMLSWGVLYDYGQRRNLYSTKARLTKTHYSTLWNNLLYGLTAAQMTVSLGDASLFPQRQASVGQNQMQYMTQEVSQPMYKQKQTSRHWTERQIQPQGLDSRSTIEQEKDVPLPTPALDSDKQKQIERQMH